MADEQTPDETAVELLSEYEEEFDAPVLSSSEEAMHWWLAAGQLLYSLRPEGLIEKLSEEYPELMDADATRELLHEARDGGKEAVDRLLDRFGDFAKVVLTYLGDYFVVAGMPEAAFLAFLPCHQGNCTVTLRGEDGKPRIRVW